VQFTKISAGTLFLGEIKYNYISETSLPPFSAFWLIHITPIILSIRSNDSINLHRRLQLIHTNRPSLAQYTGNLFFSQQTIGRHNPLRHRWVKHCPEALPLRHRPARPLPLSSPSQATSPIAARKPSPDAIARRAIPHRRRRRDGLSLAATAWSSSVLRVAAQPDPFPCRRPAGRPPPLLPGGPPPLPPPGRALPRLNRVSPQRAPSDLLHTR
jgi:hypothetical protein